MTAFDAYLATLAENKVLGADGKPLAFDIDTEIDNKLLISVAPRGYLRRIAA
jgi:cephalosporin hydroxylase